MRAIRHPRSAVACLAALLAVTVGCGGATPGESSAPTGALASAPATASPALSPPESAAPTATPLPESSTAATQAPAPEPPASEDPSDGVDGATACTGSDANRDFYAAAAGALDWAVYCPVLSSGWFVNTGEYTLRDGGRLTIEYKGPAGARFALDERGACPSADGCAPAGSEVGPAAFGDRAGTLVALDDGRLAVFAADATGTWLATGSGLEQDAFSRFAGDLVEVSD